MALLSNQKIGSLCKINHIDLSQSKKKTFRLGYKGWINGIYFKKSWRRYRFGFGQRTSQRRENHGAFNQGNHSMTFAKIALIGNPNAGKTTLFNLLTGQNNARAIGQVLPLSVKKVTLV
ncbi:Ferrous iron transport protein B [uncultured Gammaproteobacteria bacterium]|nr:Ferrous iron transport protein B [uncultured Gammaproteobacteria bacterium]